MSRARVVPVVVLLLLALGFAPGAPAEDAPPATVVLVIRHAEKEKVPPEDPPLSEVGRARAETLARLAAAAGVRGIYATSSARTRQTVEPLARRLGVEVLPYEAKEYGALAADLKRRFAGGTVVVCGHSNTLPGIVAALGGGAVGPVSDERFDDLFVVVVPAQGPGRTVHLRYGTDR